MKKDLELLATFVWPENYEHLCKALYGAGIEFFIEENTEPGYDQLFLSPILGSSEVYVYANDFEKALVIKNTIQQGEQAED
ncbi:MAG: hypothetical protein C0592_02465 [Marinilabiliales bacterium]|nr:MAG: hypothetical protein C0592_02465 [Marinilabiliales bacterium]